MSGVDQIDLAAEARDWVYRLAQGGPDEPEALAACEAWRARSPAHDAAFNDAWDAWHLIGETEVALAPDWRAELAAMRRQPAPRRWWRGAWSRPAARMAVRAGVPLALAASLAALLLVPEGLLTAPDLTVTTRIGENRVVALADGSRLTVGAGSNVDVRLGKDRREVVLDRGQAFFEVAHDPARPFYVIAGRAEIRVTGTRFDVRRVGDDVQVSVLDGRVEVRRRGLFAPVLPAPRPDRVLTAGEQSALVPAREAAFEPERPARVTPGEWRSGRLYFADATLGEIVADANRYSAVRLVLADPALADLRMTTSFRAGDVAGLLGNVQAALELDSRAQGDGTIVIARR